MENGIIFVSNDGKRNSEMSIEQNARSTFGNTGDKSSFV